MKKLMLGIFLSGWAGFVMTASAATLTVPVVPAGDGVMVDKDSDGIADRVVATAQDGDAREISNGKIWGAIYKSVFEFKLPEGDLKIKRATLVLTLNGNQGCHPDKPGSSGPETAVFYYLAPEANGAIELTDDGAGKKLGILLPGAPVKDPRQPVSCDVTSAVREAVAAKSAFLGFRLEATGNGGDNSCWRWRTGEFAEKHGKNFCPKLVIETE